MSFWDTDHHNDGPDYGNPPDFGPKYASGPTYDHGYDDDNDYWGSSYRHAVNLVDVTTPGGMSYSYHSLSDAIDYVAGNTSYSYNEIKAMLAFTDSFDGYRIDD